MEKEVAVFTLRLPVAVNETLQNKASEMGITQNALIKVFISMGMKWFDEVTPPEALEFLRSPSQNP